MAIKAMMAMIGIEGHCLYSWWSGQIWPKWDLYRLGCRQSGTLYDLLLTYYACVHCTLLTQSQIHLLTWYTSISQQSHCAQCIHVFCLKLVSQQLLPLLALVFLSQIGKILKVCIYVYLCTRFKVKMYIAGVRELLWRVKSQNLSSLKNPCALLWIRLTSEYCIKFHLQNSEMYVLQVFCW